MNRALLFLAAAAALVGQAVVSPEVNTGGNVTFRITAPKAAEVLFYGDFMPVGTTKPMQKDAKGIWSITIDSLPPSVYIYHFAVDGVTMADPVNPRMKLRARTSAAFRTTGPSCGWASIQRRAKSVSPTAFTAAPTIWPT